MTLTPQTVKQIMVIGITELVLGLLAVICGAVTMSKMSNVTFGIWAIYFALPGLLSIAAGHYKTFNTMGLALAANILGTILSVAALYVALVSRYIWDINCYYRYEDEDDWHHGHTVCTNIIVRNVTIVVIITHSLLAVVSFLGFILGCLTACCPPREPIVVFTGTQPDQPDNVVMANQNAVPTSSQNDHQQEYCMEELSSQDRVNPGGDPQLQTLPGGTSQQQQLYPYGLHQQQSCSNYSPLYHGCPTCGSQTKNLPEYAPKSDD